MRTQTIVKTFAKFDELTPEQQEQAIERVRESYYEHNDFAEWELDCDGLFDPCGPELVDAGLPDITTIFKHDPRKVYFDTGRGAHLDAAGGLDVVNDAAFRTYFGIPEGYDYRIYASGGRDSDTALELTWEEDTDAGPETAEMEAAAHTAEEKFRDHMGNVLKRIAEGIEYRYTDEAIRGDIEANEWEFELLANGKIGRA